MSEIFDQNLLPSRRERIATHYFNIRRNEMEDKGSQWKSVSRCGDFILCSECVNFLSSSRKCSSVHTGYSKERGEKSSPSYIRSKHSPHTSKAITPAHHNSNSRSTIRTYYKLKPIHEVLTSHEEISFPERILEPAEYDPSQIRHSQAKCVAESEKQYRTPSFCSRRSQIPVYCAI